jgi:hypothetical protein
VTEVPVSPWMIGSNDTMARIASAITQVAMANSPAFIRSTNQDSTQATTPVQRAAMKIAGNGGRPASTIRTIA